MVKVYELTNTKTFNNKTYFLDEVHVSQSAAEKMSADIRRSGRRSRVLLVRYNYKYKYACYSTMK